MSSNDQSQSANSAPDGVPAPDGAVNQIDTDYKVGQDNIQTSRFGINVDLHSTVFIVSSLVIVAFVIFTLVFPTTASGMFNAADGFLKEDLSWMFLAVANIFVIFSIVLIFTPLSKVRLGGVDAKPDFNYLSWLAMLFAAGMGIGLIFYGVGEPLGHMGTSLAGGSDAPLGGLPGDAEGSRHLAMAATIFHWGLHPWAIYSVVALALALFCFNKGLPLTMRSVFYPILGDRVWGWPGHIIDILAVFATLFGLATSLGLGASQGAAGLEHLFGIPNTNTTIVVLIIGITLIALLSVVLGVEKGVKRLSELNMGLALLLLVFLFVVGPTLALCTDFFSNLWGYITYLPELSNPVRSTDETFVHNWTVFYWAWWISWSPFVGMFIARVSRGRTVREFLIAVLIVPTVVGAIWMTVFGEVAIDQLVNQGFEGARDAAIELQLFEVLSQLPLASISSFIGIILVMMFFITSSDSGSLVIDSITAGGKVDAPVPQRVFWAVIEGVVAIALLLGGGLGALQTAVLTTGLPFMLVLLAACFSIVQGLRTEPRPGKMHLAS